MSILEQIKVRIKESMKAKTSDKDILRVFLGKLQQIEADEGVAKVTDERAASVARNLIKGNNEGMSPEGKTPPPEFVAKLQAENKVLESFLPNYLSADEVKAALEADADTMTSIHSAKNDGQATGIAMKFFKSKDSKVEGNTVKEVVKIIYTGQAQ
jgi:uncharacterized protein